jgi:hypothetical protein
MACTKKDTGIVGNQTKTPADVRIPQRKEIRGKQARAFADPIGDDPSTFPLTKYLPYDPLLQECVD